MIKFISRWLDYEKDLPKVELAIKCIKKYVINVSVNKIATKMFHYATIDEKCTPYDYCRDHMNALWQLSAENNWKECDKEYQLLEDQFSKRCRDVAVDFHTGLQIEKGDSYHQLHALDSYYLYYTEFKDVYEKYLSEAVRQLDAVDIINELRVLLVQGMRNYIDNGKSILEKVEEGIDNQDMELVHDALMELADMMKDKSLHL